jgi:DNA-binding Lrp family transcriptional regulator
MRATHPLGAARHAPSPFLARADVTALEMQLVAILQQDGRRPFAQIARDVGVSEKTVRSTIHRMQESQIIEITAVTLPDLVGYTGAATCGVRVSPMHTARRVAAQLAALDAVNYLAVTTGSFDMFADVVCPDKAALLSCIDTEIRSIEGVESVEAFLYLTVPYRWMGGGSWLQPQQTGPAPDTALDEMDRRILRELAVNGRESYLAIGKRLGVSEAQVRQRVKRATDAGLVRITALVNPATLGFTEMAWVGLRATNGRALELAQTLSHRTAAWYVVLTAARYDVFLELVCVDRHELRSELEDIRSSALVSALEPFVYLDLHYKSTMNF